MTFRGEKENRIEPKLQRSAAFFNDRTHHRVDVMAAPLTGKSLFRLQAIPLRSAFALWAFMALSEAHFEQVFKACFVVRVLSEELADVGFFMQY